MNVIYKIFRPEEYAEFLENRQTLGRAGRSGGWVHPFFHRGIRWRDRGQAFCRGKPFASGWVWMRMSWAMT